MFHFVLEVCCSKCFNSRAAGAGMQQHAKYSDVSSERGNSRRTACEVASSTLAQSLLVLSDRRNPLPPPWRTLATCTSVWATIAGSRHQSAGGQKISVPRPWEPQRINRCLHHFTLSVLIPPLPSLLPHFPSLDSISARVDVQTSGR
jgi:hypothetical protein